MKLDHLITSVQQTSISRGILVEAKRVIQEAEHRGVIQMGRTNTRKNSMH